MDEDDARRMSKQPVAWPRHGQHGEGGQGEASVAAARRRDAAAAQERPHPVADEKA